MNNYITSGINYLNTKFTINVKISNNEDFIYLNITYLLSGWDAFFVFLG